jgi:hypothetical protein
LQDREENSEKLGPAEERNSAFEVPCMAFLQRTVALRDDLEQFPLQFKCRHELNYILSSKASHKVDRCLDAVSCSGTRLAVISLS